MLATIETRIIPWLWFAVGPNELPEIDRIARSIENPHVLQSFRQRRRPALARLARPRRACRRQPRRFFRVLLIQRRLRLLLRQRRGKPPAPPRRHVAPGIRLAPRLALGALARLKPCRARRLLPNALPRLARRRGRRRFARHVEKSLRSEFRAQLAPIDSAAVCGALDRRVMI